MHMMLQRLKQDHIHLLRLLPVLERQLDDFHAGREHDLDLMCELVEYLATYEDQVHHPAEDLVFGRLREVTDEKGEALQTLEEQHRELAGMTKRFRDSLQAILHEGVVLRQEVEAQGRAMVGLLHRHMDLEEGEVLPLAQVRLSPGDWALIQDQAPKYNDPVFGDQDPARFRTLLQHLSQELGIDAGRE